MIDVIILTYNEQIHIERAILSVEGIGANVFVVDSGSTDETVNIAKRLGAQVYSNAWKNSYAVQFNWALDNLPIKSEWVMRLDADEYLTRELISELKYVLSTKGIGKVSGLIMPRRHYFIDEWVKRGTYPVELLRVFRPTGARCEERWMDEHIVPCHDNVVHIKGDIIDHNKKNLVWWTHKHVDYAVREAADLLDIKYDLFDSQASELSGQAQSKRLKKLRYAKAPLFYRAFFYFLYRHYVSFAFLEKRETLIWNFLQGLWYRFLVDAIIYTVEKRVSSGDRSDIVKELKDMGL